MPVLSNRVRWALGIAGLVVFVIFIEFYLGWLQLLAPWREIFSPLLILVVGMVLGLAVAYLAFRRIRGATVYRTLLIWPYAISPAVAGVLFFMIFDPTAGIFTHLMDSWFGIDVPNYREHAWLAMTAIILARAWKILGYNILFYIAVAALCEDRSSGLVSDDVLLVGDQPDVCVLRGLRHD